MRRWAVFEDEDHVFRAVTEETGDDISWPEMMEDDVQRMVDEHNAAVGERRGDGVLVGGPVGLHVCPACGLQHELPAKKREPLPWTAVAYDEGDESP